MSLKLYTALVKKDDDGKVRDISLLKNGFCSSAFFFSLFWFLLRAMWLESAVFIMVEVFIMKIFDLGYINSTEVFIVQLGFLTFIALNAKSWFSRDLQKNRGYIRKGYFLAQNKEEARLKFIENWQENAPGLSFDEFEIASR